MRMNDVWGNPGHRQSHISDIRSVIVNTKTIRPIAAANGASFLAMSEIPMASEDANPFAISIVIVK